MHKMMKSTPYKRPTINWFTSLEAKEGNGKYWVQSKWKGQRSPGSLKSSIEC